MKDAINLLCDTVKVTLGPKGNNIIIDHSNFSPYITNDGVTIAENIESDDEVINTILELAKEASIKTNEVVGDGTTTTLVLLQSIFNEGLKLIKEGINPIILKKELNIALNEIIDKIKQKSRKPTNKDLLNIAIISSNDEEIGKNISKSFIKTKNKDAININETEKEYTTLEFIKGYSLETELASPYFLNDKQEIKLKNTKILIFDNTLKDINQIGIILNEISKKNIGLIIFANDYDEYFTNEIISLNIKNDLNIYLFKTPDYGLRQKNILKDLCAISNTKIIKNDIVKLNDLGTINEIKFNKEITTLSFETNNNIKERINEIKLELNNKKNELDKDFYSKRLCMFNTCIANINIGAITTTERREKKMRYDDALCAINTASKGILPGSGITLLEISNNLEIKNNGYKILKEALIVPIYQILINSGLDYKNIINKIKQNNYKIIFNIKTNEFNNVLNTNVLDPTEVIINSIKNSCSIASMLLTTSTLIINEYKNNYNKLNNFNEL